ncbi:MAG TPA: hypothetical protein VLK84_13650, partial [Longimicrobium sp.]|nr:hypothetical protein [Longimicrobium sp.]
MNPVLSTIAPSLIRAINARKQAGDIDLGLGEPTLRPDPAPFEAATALVRDHGLPYTPNAGAAELLRHRRLLLLSGDGGRGERVRHHRQRGGAVPGAQ